MGINSSELTKAIRFVLVPGAFVVTIILLLSSNPSPTNDKKVQNLIQNVATLPSPISTVNIPPTTIVSTPRPTELPITIEHLREVDYGSWGYSAGRRSDGQVVANVHYNSSTANDLQLYATANRLLASQFMLQHRPIQVNVTFRTYVQPEQFRSWVAIMGLQIDRTEIRYVDGAGLDVTAWYKARNAGPLPQSFIDEQLAWARENVGVRTFKGVYFTSASIDATRLPQLAADPLVFLADVTPQVVRDDLIASGIQGAAQSIVGITPPSPFWKMEHDFGLQNFER